MKFICDQCSTKYSIADEKVRRKVLKIRCKNCGNIIVVRDPARGTGALTPVATEGGRVLDEAFQQVFSKSPPAARSVGPAPAPAGPGKIPVPAPALTEVRDHEPEDDNTRISLPGELRPPEAPVEDEWYLAIDGHQFGPMSFDELCRRVRRGEARSESGDEAFVWRDGFEDWIDAHSVPELRPFVPPPPPPRGRGSGLIPVAPDRAAAAAGLPVFREAAQWPVPGGAPGAPRVPGRLPTPSYAPIEPPPAGERTVPGAGEVSGSRASELFSLDALAAAGVPHAASGGAGPVGVAPYYAGQQAMVGAPMPALVSPVPLGAPAPPRVSLWLKLGVVLSFLILLCGGSALVYLLFFDQQAPKPPEGVAGIGEDRLAGLGAEATATPDAAVAGLEFAPVQVGRSRERPGAGRPGGAEAVVTPTPTPKPAARELDDGLTPEQRRLIALYGEKDNGAVPRTARESGATRGPARDLTDREVQQVLAQFRGRIQSCYERAAKRDYSLGELRVDATVDLGPSGRVRAVTLKGVANDVLADCLRSTLRQLVFKPIGGDGQTLSMPFIFRGA